MCIAIIDLVQGECLSQLKCMTASICDHMCVNNKVLERNMLEMCVILLITAMDFGSLFY